jgi:putative SOS response-associated peptidase YedK
LRRKRSLCADRLQYQGRPGASWRWCVGACRVRSRRCFTRRRSEPDDGTTNIRNTSSKHWTRWLGVENRCVVPLTRFAERDPGSNIGEGRTPYAWFEAAGYQPLMFFAGSGCRNGRAFARSRGIW